MTAHAVRITCGDADRAGCVGRRGQPLVLEELWRSISPDVFWSSRRRTTGARQRPPSEWEQSRGIGKVWEPIENDADRVMSAEIPGGMRFVCPVCRYGPVDVPWQWLSPWLDYFLAANVTSWSVQLLKRMLSDSALPPAKGL